MAKHWKQKLAIFNTKYQNNVNLIGGAFLGVAIVKLTENNIFLWIILILLILAIILNRITIRFTFENCPYCNRILKKKK